MFKISIVTVSMNRTQHIIQQARLVSRLRGHIEHVILDFGSTIPIKRNQLPDDDRIKFHRVESPNSRWWLTHSYNLAFALAIGDYILKLDADTLPSQYFIDALYEDQVRTGVHLMCNRLTLQDWSLPSKLFTTNGLFLCKKSSLACIGGFNPYIQGWGWDEIDLFSRFFLAGFSFSRILSNQLSMIDHGDDLREAPIAPATMRLNGIAMSILLNVSYARRKDAQNEKNRRIAVASIERIIKWPSFCDYVEIYRKSGRLPVLPNVSIFSSKEKLSLEADLRSILLKPSRMQNFVWKIAGNLGFGPYSPLNTKALLDAFNIDLSLVV